jgi:spore germination protein YaaH
MNATRHAPVLLVAAGAVAIGCWRGDDLDRTGDHVVRRDTAVIVEGCALDEAQLSTLTTPAARKVLREVIFLCGAIDREGDITPAAVTRASFAEQVAQVHALGYRVSLAATLGTDWDRPSNVAATTAFLGAEDARTNAAAQLAALADATSLETIDLAMPQLDEHDRRNVTAFVAAVSAAVHPAHQLGVFAPPSVQRPSDIPGGDAYDLPALGGLVDRMRLMTLDYSCCGAPLGPTTDPGWAVAVERFAKPDLPPASRVAVSYPLYGWDGVRGSASATPVTYGEAMALAAKTGANVQRGPTGAPYFDYVGEGGNHQVWFDDTTSTMRALHAWNDALPSSVDLVLYGLGAEDPTLWTALAAEVP